MLKVYAIVAISTVAALGCTTLMAADHLEVQPCCMSRNCQTEGGASECDCSGAPDCGSASGCCGCGICASHRAHIASFGYFNCSCRGSYKFPVPPQYTYHWPGMYSQRCMTAYTSPYRFPPLELPKLPPQGDEKLTAKPVIQGVSADLKAINPAKPVPLPARLSARPTPMSVRIKQKYGLK